MKKAIFFSSIVLLLIAIVLGGIKYLQITALIEKGKSNSPPAVSISSSFVTPDLWENTLTSVGSLEASKGLVLTADLPGRIAEILFDAGSTVSSGDVLIRQDTSAEQAQLRSARANADQTRANLKRIQELYSKKVASKAELDEAKSSHDAALAQVDSISANMDKKVIKAPFQGRLGIRLVNLGQSINAGDPLVSLQATKKMLVNFSLPQQYLYQLKKQLPIRITTDAIPHSTFAGSISAIDPEIDDATRSIRVQAILDDSDQDLLPGMFVSVAVILPKHEEVLLIPITAVQFATYGDSVFVLETSEDDPKQRIARQQFVKIGKTRGDYVVVIKGLQQGDEVVAQGGFKLQNGASVTINNQVVPDYSLKPSVQDQ